MERLDRRSEPGGASPAAGCGGLDGPAPAMPGGVSRTARRSVHVRLARVRISRRKAQTRAHSRALGGDDAERVQATDVEGDAGAASASRREVNQDRRREAHATDTATAREVIAAIERELATRIGPLVGHWPESEVRRLLSRMARLKYKYEGVDSLTRTPPRSRQVSANQCASRSAVARCGSNVPFTRSVAASAPRLARPKPVVRTRAIISGAATRERVPIGRSRRALAT